MLPSEWWGRTVLRAHVFSVVRGPRSSAHDGTRFERDIVRHPGAVAVVAVTDGGGVVLVGSTGRRLTAGSSRYRPAPATWPASRLRRRPDRELVEEAGYRADRMDLLVEILNTPGFCDESTSICTWPPGSHAVPPTATGSRSGTSRWWRSTSIGFDAMVDDGSIVDAQTILGVGLARRRLAPADAGMARQLQRRGRGIPGVAARRAGSLGPHPGRLPPRPRRLRTMGRRGRHRPDRARAPARSSATSKGCGPAASARRRVARATTALRGLFRFLVDEGVGTADPTAEVRSPKLPRRLPKALAEHEVLALLAAAGGPEPIDLRDRALLELLYATGARISEAVGLSLGDLSRDDGLVSLFGKGSKERLVPLGGPAQAALERWLGPAGRP